MTISAYGIYGAWIAPLIEGESLVIEQLAVGKPDGQLVDGIMEKLKGYFKKDGWEWDDPTILDTQQATVLFLDHKVLDDGSVELKPLSMVLKGSPADESAGGQESQPIILRAPEGAKLKFTRPISSGNVGDLESGQLIGEVQIFRPASDPEKNDDGIYLLTENVQISPERIFTLFDCHFQFGKSYGHGKHLTVDLNSPTDPLPGRKHAFQGVQRVELARVHEMVLHREEETRLHAPGQSPEQDDLLGNANGSFRVTTNGPMLFDFQQRSVVFRDQVLVRSLANDGDQLSCNKLTVVMNSESSTDSEDPKFEVERLLAEGTPEVPAIITSVSRNAQVVARSIDYDLGQDQVTLIGDQQVSIARDGQQIAAREIRYQFTNDGRIGQAVMLGPGQMTHPGDANGKGDIVCTWQNKLTLQDDDGQKLFSLEQARIRMDETDIAADQMHFWVWEIPEPRQENRKQQWKMEPARFFAQGRVSIQSPRLNGNCNKATAYWPPVEAGNAILRSRSPVRYVVGYRPQEPAFPAEQELSWESTTPNRLQWHDPKMPQLRTAQTESTVTSANATGWQSESATRPGQRTRITGDEIQLQMRSGKQRGEFSEITVTGQVVVQQQQEQVSGAFANALELRGHQLRVISQGPERYRLFVAGFNATPASVVHQQLQLQGNAIHLDQVANRLWIEGPGNMHLKGADRGPSTGELPLLPSTQNPDQARLLSAGNTTVNWLGGMVFDGQTIYFETGVRSESRQLDEQETSTVTSSRSAALSISLDQRIDFLHVDEEQQNADIQVQRLVMVGRMHPDEVAFGEFWLESDSPTIHVSTIKQQRGGETVSAHDIHAPKATFDVATGSVQSNGPGWVIARMPSSQRSDSSLTPARLASTGDSAGSIDYIKVNFDVAFQGDLESKNLTFEGNVHTFYTDTQRWDVDPDESYIRRPGSRGMILDCTRLTLAQWTPRSAEPTIEMIATGNSRVRGNQFNAVADRISYVQSTGQVVMEAPTRSNAEIWFEQPGKSNQGYLMAKTITYNVDTGEYQVQEMKQIDYSTQEPIRK